MCLGIIHLFWEKNELHQWQIRKKYRRQYFCLMMVSLFYTGNFGWMVLRRIALMVLSMWPRKQYFSHSSLVLHFFSIPPLKLTLGVQIGGRLLIANHLDQSLWSANQGVAVKSYVLYLFIAVRSYLLSCTLSFIRLSIPWKNARPKSLCWDYFLIQFDFVRPHTEHPLELL
jgi:hypothetical protein